MIPILYEADETQFISNGIGRIPCTSCHVREQRNGIYECEFTVSVDEEIFPEITEGRIIGCIHDDQKDVQPFDIYGRTAPMNGLVTFYAHHISYRLAKIVAKPFTAATIAEAFTKFVPFSVNTNPFTFWTDKSVTANFAVKVPTAVRSLLGGSAGSILDVYGKGEYEFDKWTVKLHVNRGHDNGVTIRYGKNLTDIRQETDASDTYNAVAPYWKSYDDTTIVTLPEGFIADGEAESYQVIPLDLSTYWDEAPTAAQLRSRALAYLQSGDGWEMKENITVDFVPLWQSPEYADIAALERVSLCDKVSVVHPILGIAANKIQVIEVDYDVLAERYRSMELGKARSTFVDTIKADVTDYVVTQVPTVDSIQEILSQAILDATNTITGNKGGHVVIKTDANGKPQEFLVMDTDDINTAVNVWRWNLSGLAHSSNGYNGTYDDVAILANGKINASAITTGTLTANIIKAGIIADVLGKNSWNLTTGQLVTTLGQIGGWTISDSGIYKEVTISGTTYRIYLQPLVNAYTNFLRAEVKDGNYWYPLVALSVQNGLQVYNADHNLVARVDGNGITSWQGTTGNYVRSAMYPSGFYVYDESTVLASITKSGFLSQSIDSLGDTTYMSLGSGTLAITYKGNAKFSVNPLAMHFYNQNGDSVFSVVYTDSVQQVQTSLNFIPNGASGAQVLGSESSPWSQLFSKGIELYNTTGYIDFHYNRSTSDYTSRIIEISSGVLQINGQVVGTSDKRLKDNIAEVEEKELALISKLKPRTYNYNHSEYKSAGLVAQEVLEAEEELGIEDSLLVRGTGGEIPDPKDPDKTITDYYAVDYNGLTSLLLAQVQKLTEQVYELTAEVKALKGGAA